MSSLKKLEEEINKIKARNKRVETEKAWETSWSRRLTITVLTYLVVSIFFYFMGDPEPLQQAIVPSLAFVLSILSSPLMKKIWLKYIHKG
jgi:hypothetical protein